MFKKVIWSLVFLALIFFFGVALTQAQTSTPTVTVEPSTATPQPTQPPAILVIQPTPVLTAPLQGNLWQQLQQVWQQNKAAILLAIITTLVTGVLIGVFIKNAAERISAGLGRLFHYLFDNFAGAPFIRWRYEKRYRETLADAVQELQGGNLVEREIRLDQMYVPSLLTEETSLEARLDFADRYRTRDEMRRRQQARSVGPWDAIRKFHRFIVLGDPGAGKTTYLYHLAFMCAHRRRPEVEKHIPIFIRFRELVKDLAGIEHLEDVFPKIFADYNFPNADRFIENRLKKGRFLILLDGLDELPSEDDHKRMIELAQDFADRHVREQVERGQQNILVISSRTHSYEHGQQLRGFTKTKVMEFSEAAIERFVHNWFAADKDNLADELVAALNGNERFLELARNPLLLLLIAYHYERERNLPDLRAELYRHCIRTRVTRWNTIRGTHRGRFGEQIKWNMLGELALHIFQHESQGLLEHRTLLDWLEAFAQTQRLPEGTTPEDLLDEIARTSGLIHEWAIDRYGFSHQTLQEFFAADALYQLGPQAGAAQLGEHLTNPAWKEVILLYCGLTKDAEPLLQLLLDEVRGQPDGRALWLLAGQCMAEGAQRVAEPLRQELADKLVLLLREPEEGPVLTADESRTAVINLKAFAADLLPDYARNLMRSGSGKDFFLAERLLPPGADVGLKEELARQMAALAGSDDTEEQQAAVAAIGRLGWVGTEGAAALLAGLDDDDAAVRAEAARALGQLKIVDDAGADALLQVYEMDEADEVRHAALESLLALGRAADVGMVLVPAGEFLMGSSDKDREADKSEQPQHTVYLPAYFMDKTPVTNAQFAKFMAAGGYANPDYWPEAIEANRWKDGKYLDEYSKNYRAQPEYWADEKWNQADCPVVGVTWYEAMAYARWAGKRLPTEAEWEKAARGADGNLYPWGNEWDAAKLNSKETKQGKTTPVGQYSPGGDSPYGAVDMAGNVWEWCSTRWWNENKKEYEYEYSQDDGREDLSGGDDVVRVLRGGSWANDKKLQRCGARYWSDPWIRYYYWGFRCCCATSSLSRSGS